MRHGQKITLAALVVGIAGCASLAEQEWVQKTRDASMKTARTVADSTSKSMKRMQAYLAEKDVLQTFQDAGEHSEAAVLDVLRKAGIGKSKATPPKGGATPGPTPAPVPPKSLQPPPPLIPEKYSGTLRWPLDAGIISSEYGPRKGKMHKGMDIAADTGEPVYAVADGTVIYSGNGLSGYGNLIIVRHDQQMTSLYAHNSELKVREGEHVTKGSLIALLGNTGRSTGPHVHFEVRQGDAPVNPRAILPQSELSRTGAPAAHVASAAAKR
jgi:murein DD-endopeptidase MepM/ murein hydrolase activator NlpD